MISTGVVTMGKGHITNPMYRATPFKLRQVLRTSSTCSSSSMQWFASTRVFAFHSRTLNFTSVEYAFFLLAPPRSHHCMAPLRPSCLLLLCKHNVGKDVDTNIYLTYMKGVTLRLDKGRSSLCWENDSDMRYDTIMHVDR